MRVVEQQEFTWKDCSSVVVEFPWNTNVQREVYMWMMFELGVKGRNWEQSTYQRPPLEVEFVFAEPKYATLFALKWSDLVVTDSHK